MGKVYLVGAGPGDPGLITVRGRECLERADVVVYDFLSNPELLVHAPQAEHILVGKAPEKHTLLQEEINRVLVEQARRVSRVVRLKGGDPFVFGRGGEEAEVLAAHAIPFEVVPGVTAGIAAPAYSGIPVTHRGLSSSYTLIAGHEDLADGDLFQVATQGTFVFYMGVRNLPKITEQLMALGRKPDTPAAVIEWGTYPRQRTVVATLETIEAVCAHEKIEAPAIVVVGEVVALHETINWFENRPLSGKRIVVTRASSQAPALVRSLRELGGDVFEFPTIQIEPATVEEPMEPIGSYDWVVLTSVNGVDMLFERLEALGQDARALSGVKLCVIGSATGEAVRKRFLRCDLVPEKYVAEELLPALETYEGSLEGKRFLLPRADIARSFLPKELRARGAEVTELVAYRTTVPSTSSELADALVSYQADLVTFTSSSTARNFCDILTDEQLQAVKKTATFASIGPITTKTANSLNMKIAIEPARHDIPGLVQAIVEHYRVTEKE